MDCRLSNCVARCCGQALLSSLVLLLDFPCDVQGPSKVSVLEWYSRTDCVTRELSPPDAANILGDISATDLLGDTGRYWAS
jgi:hypothetical protein